MMEGITWLIPALGCILMMVVMMWLMGKGLSMFGGDKDESGSNKPDA
jgi:hypothetical protein